MNKNKISAKADPSPTLLHGLLRQAFGRFGGWVNAGRRLAKPSRPLRRAPLHLEALEPRILLSGSIDSAGVLMVTGTAATDVIQIEQTAIRSDGAFVVDLTFNGLWSQFGLDDNAPGVTSVVVNAGGGNDEIRLLSALTMDASIDGGDGVDAIFGANEDTDWILSSAGGGVVGDIAFSAVERLVGGSAADLFKIASGGTVSMGIDGGGGDDALVGDDIANSWTITGSDAGTLNGMAFANIRNLVGGSANDRFAMGAGGAVSGVIEGGGDNADAAMPAVDTIDYAARLGPLTVNLATNSAPSVGRFADIDRFVGTASTADTFIGPDKPTVLWSISGPDQGSVGGVVFEGFENLRGASNNSDVFIFLKNADGTGSLSGMVDGGSGGADSLIVRNSETEALVVNPGGADSAGSVTLFGRTVAYAGIDQQKFLEGSDPQNLVIAGSVADDRIRVFGDASQNLNIAFEGLGFYSFSGGSWSTTQSIQILQAQVVALESLRIDGRDGADTITVASLPTGFAANLKIYGSRLPIVSTLAPIPEEDPFNDTVVFSGSIDLQDHFVDVWADTIRVLNDVVIDVGDNFLVFRARLTGIPDLENLSPVLGTDRRVEITVGDRARINASSIYLIAEADDKSIADLIGVPQEVGKFLIEPLADQVAGILALPVKVLVKNSTATVTIGTDAELNGTAGAGGTVGIYATAGAVSSGKASSSLISIGYAQAKATATIDIKAGSRITAGDAVVVTSTGTANASISASTDRKIDSTPNPGKAQVAIALGVAYADVTSTVNVAQGAVITGGKTANVGAKGGIESGAEAETGIFATGLAGLAFAVEISKANVGTTVDGTVKALAKDGYTVKIEIDPLVTWDGTGDPPAGYVDHANNRIYVGPHALVTEDVITYTNRRGNSIGGLVDGREYYVIALDDPGWIKLADSAGQALRAGLGEAYHAGNVVDLVPDGSGLPPVDVNRLRFNAADVDAAADTVTLRRNGAPVFNTFELGQAVVYHAPAGGTAIPGLVDGGTYYVVAATAQNNLQGDSRFADEQIIQLAESENEARGGVFIALGAATGNGHEFFAKHVLDSGFVTGVGVTADLQAENKASASAGLKSADDPNADKSKWDKFKEVLDFNLGEKLLEKGTENYRNEVGNTKSGASNNLNVAGALALIFADHKVRTDVTGTADLKSNEDLEVKATLTQKYELGAASSTEPQEDTKDKDGNPVAKKGAENSVSVALGVAVIDNSAIATVHGGARLDALRANRVIADISYPFKQRLDTYVPLSWGELTDAVRTDGAEAITKYISTDLGAKDAFFNTWTTASSLAEKVGIAGAVTVLVFNNDARALVKAGALLNQDLGWRDDALNPHGNQASRQDDDKGEQVVSVEATNYQQTINMTGIFSLPDLPDIDPTDPNATKKNFSKFGESVKAGVWGTGGKTGGAGGALFISVQTNKTHAIIEDGAAVYSGGDGGFNMKAEEALLNVHLAQSAAKGGDFAIAGSVLYNGHSADTLVQLGAAATVSGRDARLYAGNLNTTATWAGGVAKGEALGVGISVAINKIDRSTQALIGDQVVTAGTPILGSTHITVDEVVNTKARVSGDVWAFTLAGAFVSEDKKKDDPSATDDPSSPTSGVDTSPIFGPLTQEEQAQKDKDSAKTGIGIAAAASVNLIGDTTISRIADAGTLRAGSVNVEAENDSGLIAATGGLAVVLGKSGDASLALAGAFSYNEVSAVTLAEIQDSSLLLTGMGASGDVLRVNALTTSSIFALAAGGSLASASGGNNNSGTTAISIAGSVTINTINGGTTAALRHGSARLDRGDASVKAEDASSIFAIAGGLSVSIARGSSGSSSASTAVSAGAAVAVNKISSSVSALIEDTVGNGISWAPGATGQLTVEALNTRSIGAYTLAGAVAVAQGTQGNGVAGALAASGSVNQIEGDTLAALRRSIINVPGAVSVHASDSAKIHAAAGGIAVAVGLSSKGNGGAGAFGAGFAINNIGSSAKANDVWADVHMSTLTAKGPITLKAESLADIFALAIGAAGSVTGSGSGNALSGSLAGSFSINKIRNNTQTRVRGSSVNGDSSLSVKAKDSSTINSTAGALALSIAVAQDTAVSLGLGISLTKNDIVNATRASIIDSPVDVDGTLTVDAASTARIDSLAFGVAIGVSISSSARAISANATGALSFNAIDNVVGASIGNSTAGGTAGIAAGGTVSVTASDDSTIAAIATAAAASISGSGGGDAISVSIGLALAHNRIDKDVLASIVNVPSLTTQGGDVVVGARDAATIKVTSVAAAAAVAIGSRGVGVAGGASESTNIILTRTNASIENSRIGSSAARVGKVDLDASSTSKIDAVVAGVAIAAGVGTSSVGVGVAVGVAVARNFIGNDPNANTFGGDPTVFDNTVPQASLTPGLKVRIVEGALQGDVYEYIGPLQTDSDLSTTVHEDFDLRAQQYRDPGAWKLISVGADRTQVKAYIDDSSIDASGALTVDAHSSQNIDAIVIAAAVGIGGGSTTGVAVSAAGSYAENKIRTDVQAYIDGDGADAATDGIRAGSVALRADDASGISAVAGAASLAVGFGGTTGVAVAVGVSLAFNEVDNDVDASIRNADQGVKTATGGDITISARTLGRDLFRISAGGPISAADLDDAAEAEADNPNDPLNPNDDVDDPADDAVNEARVDAVADHAILSTLRSLFTGDLALSTKDELRGDSVLTTASGRQAIDAIAAGDQIRFADPHDFATGDKVIYERSAGASAGGPASGTYYVIRDSEKLIRLATSLTNAKAGTAITIGAAADLSGHSLRQLWDMGLGVTVKVLDGHTGAGVLGQVYQYVGPDRKDVDLKTEDFTSANWLVAEKLKVSIIVAGQSWMIVAPDGKSFVLERQGNGDIVVSRNTISAVSVAASVGVGLGFGGAGIGVSGAGAVAQNVILSKTNAYGADSVIDSGRHVTLSAISTSDIDATVVAATVAVGAGTSAGIGASIGVAVSRNFIGSTPYGPPSPVEVQATLTNTSVMALGNLRLISLADQTIDAIVIAGSVAVGLSLGIGVAISGSGVFAENTIGGDVKSSIQGDGAAGIHAASVSLLADDTSTIDALAGAVSVAVALGLNAGVGVAIGVSLAFNTITSQVEASIIDADDLSTLSGDINLAANEDASIRVVSFAASIALGIGGGALAGAPGIGVSGAGAVSSNVILTRTNAFVRDSNLRSAGDVDLSAHMRGLIDAKVIAVAVAVGIGESVGLGVAIGVAVARNFIGWDPSDLPSDTTSLSQDRVLTQGMTVDVLDGVRKGGVYEFIGDNLARWKYDNTNTNAPALTKGDLVKVAGTFNARALDFHTKVDTVAESLTFGRDHGFVTGDIVSFSSSQGDVGGLAENTFYRVEKVNDRTIKLRDSAGVLVNLVAADWAAGSNAIAKTAPGIYRYVGADKTSVSLTDTVQHYATSTDWQLAGANDLSDQDYGDVTLWRQRLDPGVAQVRAFIDDASVHADQGTLAIQAEAAASIDAVVIAASVALGGGGGVGLAVAGGGVYVSNQIDIEVRSTIDGDGSSGISAHTVKIDAVDSSGINAVAGAASVAGAIGGAAGALAVSVGLSLAFNEVGNDVQASIVNADQGVTAGAGGITVSALSQGKPVFAPFNLAAAGLTADMLDDAALADVDEEGGPNEATIDAKADTTILELLREAFRANGVTLAQNSSLAAPAMFKTNVRNDDGNHIQDLREGNTVEVGAGYDNGKGETGRVYRYIGAADRDGVDLAKEDYSNATLWLRTETIELTTLVKGRSWSLLAPNGDDYVLTLEGGMLNVTASTINAVAVAASVAVSFGGQSAGVAVAGAGAVSQNVVRSSAQAFVQDSTVVSGRDVELSATSASEITATIVAVSVSVGAGASGGIGAAIGIAVARNFIGWTPGGMEMPVDVKAYLKDSSVRAAGDITLSALTDQTIGAIVIAGSAAVGAGGVGVAGAGSGVFAENMIGVDTASYIHGDGEGGVSGASVSLRAEDRSTINSLAGAISLAGGFGGVGAALAIGVSLARNTISSDVDAYILNADGAAADVTDHGVTATGAGGITVSASSSASIQAVTFAASLSVGVGVVGIAVSGAGADANNVILTGTHAYVDGSALRSAGKVDIDALASGDIDATVVGIAAAVGGGAAGAGLAIGVAMASNNIGWRPDRTAPALYTTASRPASIVSGDTVKIASGANAGNVYRYIGLPALQRPVAHASNNQNWLSQLNYADRTLWAQDNLTPDSTEVQAYVLDSNLLAGGALTLDARSTQSIDASVLAGAVAVSAGLVGASLSGAGASAENRIATLVEASIEGNKDGRGVVAGSVGLHAQDSSTIDASAEAVSVAAVMGIAGGSLAIGVGLAYNTIDNVVISAIEGAAVTANALTGGDISLTALESATIDARAAATSVAVTVALYGIALAGAGTGATNVIGGATSATVVDSTLTSEGSVTLLADGDATISADLPTVAVAVGATALAVAVSVTENIVNSTVDAYIQESTVTAKVGHVKVTADSGGDVDAKTLTVAVAIGLGGAAAVSDARSTINGHTQAYLGTGARITASVGSVIVTSTSTAVAKARQEAGAGSIGVTVTSVSGISSVTAATRAYVAAGAIVSARNLFVQTDDAINDKHTTRTATAHMTAGSAGIVGVTAGGATAEITGDVQAYIGRGARITTSGTVEVTADAKSTVTTTVGGGAGGALGVSSLKAFANVGSSTDAVLTEAYVDEGSVITTESLKIHANDVSLATSTVTTIGLGLVGVADGTTKASLYNNVTARLGPQGAATLPLAQRTTVNATGNVTVTGRSTSEANVGITLGSGGLGAGANSTATATVIPNVIAAIGNDSRVTAGGNVKVGAESHRATANAATKGIAIGGIAVGTIRNDGIVTPKAHASIGDDASVVASGRVDVLADILAKTDTTTAALGDTFRPATDVNTTSDTIRFPSHGLTSGDSVTYDPNGFARLLTAGGGLAELEPDREFRVIVVNNDLVKLGSMFGAGATDIGSPFATGAGVDGIRDVIRFTSAHKFLSGDAVRYDPGTNLGVGGAGLTTAGTYYVRVIDERTISLHATQAEAKAAAQTINLGAGGGANTITVGGAGFANGTRVTYRAPEPVGFTRDLVEQKVNPNIDADTPSSQYYLGNGIADSFGINGHGFSNGDRINYRSNGTAITGLVNNGVYYVIVVNPDTIQLSLTLDGTNPDDDGDGPNIGITPVVIDRSGPTALQDVEGGVRHLFERAPINGLVHGKTYVVVNSSGATFSLADPTTPTTVIVLDKTARSGAHTIARAGIDLSATGGTHELRIDLIGPLPDGDHLLLGLGGTSLRQISPPAGDGLSHSTVSFGAGGGVAVNLPKASLTITNNAQAWIAGTLVEGEAGIKVATQSVGRGYGYISAVGGGAISAMDDEAKVDIANTSKAFLTADGVTLKSKGLVQILSDSSMDTHVFAAAEGGGVGAGSNARALTRVNSDSANGDFGTLTQVGQGARIEGDTVNLNAQVSHLATYAHSRAIAGGFVAVAIANSNIDTDSTVLVKIDTDARIKATRGVDIGAFHRNVTVDYDRLPIPIAFIPIPIWQGGNETALTDRVVAKDGARIQTAPRANSDTVLRTVSTTDTDPDTPPPYNRLALLVEANNVNTVDVQSAKREISWDADVEISAGPSPEVLIGADGSVIKAIGATVTLAAGVNGAATVSDIPNSGAGGGQVLFIANKILNDTPDGPDVGKDFKAMFQFADTFAGVTITNLSTRALIINNISVGGGTEPSVDLQATGSGAEASLTFDLRRTVAPTQVVVENLNTVAGFGPDIVLMGRIENPIGQTRITALTGDIVAGTARDPAGGLGSTLIRTRDLTLDAPMGTIGYDKENPGARHHLAVDIVQGPLVVFDEAKLLETGDAVVYRASVPASSLGTLVDGRTYFLIRLDDQRVRLAASLPDALNGVAIAIDPANLEFGNHTISKGGTTLAITSGIRLVAQAGADNFIDLKGRLRDPAALLGDVGDVNPNPHVFDLDLIRAGLLPAGGNVDVILQEAVAEMATGNAGGVRVRATVGPAVNKIWFNQFRPDDPSNASFGAAVDVGFFGNNPVAIKGTYNFVNPQGGTAGLVASGTGLNNGNIVVNAFNPNPTATQVNLTGITDILGAGTGHIDVKVNGFVILTEQIGDMRVGAIESTANDVTLTAPASIIDADPADDAAGLNDPADVIGRNITLRALAGGIGAADNFLETNLLDTIAGVAQNGVLRADAPQSIFIEETLGNLRVHHVASTAGNVTLVARQGSIVDGNADTELDADLRVRDTANVIGYDIDLDARLGGSIGIDADDLDIDSRPGGRLFAQAAKNVYLTETHGALVVLAARALGGDLRLTVPDTSDPTAESLELLGSGRNPRILESGATPVVIVVG